jgi:hypothetical protein
VPDDLDSLLLRRLIGGYPEAATQLLERASKSTSTSLMVAAGLISRDAALLNQAAQHAATTRDRQVVALADACLRGDSDLLDVLVREHLAEYPDNVLAAWIAGLPAQSRSLTTRHP